MKEFIGEQLLLSTDTGAQLYRRFAENAPIADFHCHIDPKQIYEDRHYENLTRLWLGEGGSFKGDHYKWRLMRAQGIQEEYISGGADDSQRFLKWAQCLERAVGNPIYHWCHMELKKYFGYEGWLGSKNAQEVYQLCNERLAQKDMGVRNIIRMSDVRLICTTDDPADDLIWHKKLRQEGELGFSVVPAFRPDRAISIEKADYGKYIKRLSDAVGFPVKSTDDLKRALCARMDAFQELGCRGADHGLERMVFAPASDARLEQLLRMGLSGEKIGPREREEFTTGMLLFLGQEYARRGWVMQLHYGAKRDNNSRIYEKMGPDVGCDCIYGQASVAQLADFLNELDKQDKLPKTIIYNLDPSENEGVNSVIGCFQREGTVGKLQHGAAWWFSDSLEGIKAQLICLAQQGVLGGFVGMLTDSRSFLSYTRHDYFRRILCSLLGQWVEQGLYPADMDTLGEIVKDICYNNAVRYFGFPLDTI